MLGSLVTSSRRVGGPIGFAGLIAGLVLVLAEVAFGSHAAAHEEHAGSVHPLGAETGGTATRVRLPEVELITADGQPFALSAAGFGDRVVLIDFVYTRCTTICPALSAVMASAHEALSAHLGRDLVLISVSVDPAGDTPEVLRAYAANFEGGPQWIWLTGNQGPVGRVLRAFGLSTGSPDEHPPLLLAGHPAEGRWLRWVGIPAPQAVIDQVETMIRQRPPAGLRASNGKDGKS